MDPPALLLVYSEPGPNVTEEEFHDWYDNEHIPLRVKVPAFTSWTRWVAIDDKKPTWAASYDLESYQSTQRQPYTLLAETRSEREKNIFKNVGFVDRRTYEKYTGYPDHPPSELFDPTQPAPIVQFVGLDPKPEMEDELNKWYFEEHTPMLAKVPGFIRARRFVLKDSGRLGVQASEKRDPVGKYLAVYEWTSSDAFKTKEFQDAISTPWGTKMLSESLKREAELRVVKFYKGWEKTV